MSLWKRDTIIILEILLIENQFLAYLDPFQKILYIFLEYKHCREIFLPF